MTLKEAFRTAPEVGKTICLRHPIESKEDFIRIATECAMLTELNFLWTSYEQHLRDHPLEQAYLYFYPESGNIGVCTLGDFIATDYDNETVIDFQLPSKSHRLLSVIKALR